MRSRPSQLRVALALSVLLHVAIGLWLWRHRSEPTARVEASVAAPVEVEITETVRPAPASVRTASPSRSPGAARVSGSRTVRPVPLPDLAQPLAQQPGGIPVAPGLASDRPSRPLANLEVVPGAVLSMGPAVTRGEPPSAQAVASGLMRQLAAQNRLERGAPRNGYFSELRISLEALWQVEVLLAQHHSLDAETDHARVRLVQAPDGSLRDVAFVTPPNSGELGRALLADLHAGAATLPRPPPEVVRGHAEVASVWDFTLKAPSSPIKLSFDFDLTSLVDKRAIPKPTRKRVEFLLAEE